MEVPGSKSRTILLQDMPPMPAPGDAADDLLAQAAAAAVAAQAEQATVQFDLDDLTPVDAAPVALLMASRESSDRHSTPPPAEAPVKLDAPKPRMEVSPKRGGMALRRAPWLNRALADGASAVRLLIDAAKLYARNIPTFTVLTIILFLPLVATKSCLVAVSTGSTGAIATTVDLSQVKADLTRKAKISKAQGKVDKAALAELAALETVAAASASPPNAEGPSDFARTARWLGAALLTGILMLGLAIPLGHGAVTIFLVEHTTSGRWLSVSEALNRLWRRRLALAASLLPAALIMAAGSALWMVPGLLAAALLLFVPAIVIFEKSSGTPALARSLRLVRAEGVRVLVVMLTLLVFGAAAYLLAGAVMPEGPRRIHVFLRLLLGDGLLVAVFPIPALAVARLYLDLRVGEGGSLSALAHASRR
jgi:hypothetical protein